MFGWSESAKDWGRALFKELVYPLVQYFTPFNVFRYITLRAAYAAGTALLVCFVFGPRIIEVLRRRRMGEEIRDDGPKTHLAKSGTPTMGGLMIILAITVSAVLWMNVRNLYAWVGLLTILAFGAIGLIDDMLKHRRHDTSGLRGRIKLAGQIGVSLAVALTLYHGGDHHTTLLYFPFLKHAVLDLSWLYIPFAVLLLVSTTNAVNLTDGLDGLAAGLVIMSGLTLTILAYVTGRVDFAGYLQIPYVVGAGELAVLGLGVVGAAIGFLWYNAHPAEVMMGDTGSLALGGALGVMALMLKKEVLLIVIGGVFVIEVMSVIIQVVSYRLRGKRVFLMAPLHHHFELKGWPECKVVLRLWILGGLFAILSLSTLKLR